MHTTAATVSAVNFDALSVRPINKNTRQVSKSVATVMPEIGFDDEPIVPVRRDETVTNKKPNTTIIAAPTSPSRLKPRPRLGTAASTTTSARLPNKTTDIGM